MVGLPDRGCEADANAMASLEDVGGRVEVEYQLYRLAFKGDEGAFSQTARAIAVLAHEAWHLRGEDDEGVTNCYAFQSGVGLGERLGLSAGTAARMMRQQLAENPIQAKSAPAYLVPPECRNGRQLDLEPGVDHFP